MSLILDLMRHGEPSQTGLLLGKTDLPLSASGEQEVKSRLAKSMMPWCEVYSSPLTRVAQSAQWLYQEYSHPIQIDEAIREYDFGDWDGMSLAELYAQQSHRLEQFWRDPAGCPPPNAEALHDFKKRVFDKVTSLLESDCKHALFMTHGGVILAIIAEILGVPDGDWAKIKIDYASFSRVVITQTDDGWWGQVVLLNADQLPVVAPANKQ
ncbi:MAG: histidine phosphatase family protein [Pontibacterium sp.]